MTTKRETSAFCSFDTCVYYCRVLVQGLFTLAETCDALCSHTGTCAKWFPQLKQTSPRICESAWWMLLPPKWLPTYRIYVFPLITVCVMWEKPGGILTGKKSDAKMSRHSFNEEFHRCTTFPGYSWHTNLKALSSAAITTSTLNLVANLFPPHSDDISVCHMSANNYVLCPSYSQIQTKKELG